MHAIICILEFMNFMLFLIKLIKFKQRIKFKQFELHNYGPTQVFVQLHLNRFGRFCSKRRMPDTAERRIHRTQY